MKQDNDLEKARLARAFSASVRTAPCTGPHCAICFRAAAGVPMPVKLLCLRCGLPDANAMNATLGTMATRGYALRHQTTPRTWSAGTEPVMPKRRRRREVVRLRIDTVRRLLAGEAAARAEVEREIGGVEA